MDTTYNEPNPRDRGYQLEGDDQPIKESEDA